MIDIQILSVPLNISQCIETAKSSGSGGIVSFVGTVRDSTNGRSVVRLEYETYENMAKSELHKIAREVVERWPVENVVIHHRSGILTVGEVSVVIVTCAPHRKAAFESCEYIINTLKQTVPIWKKEVYDDGEVWVSAHA